MNTGQEKPPSPIEKVELVRGGLGQKNLVFLESGSNMEFHEDLLDAFPKLSDGGDYELLHTVEGNNKLLDVIPATLWIHDFLP